MRGCFEHLEFDRIFIKQRSQLNCQNHSCIEISKETLVVTLY